VEKYKDELCMNIHFTTLILYFKHILSIVVSYLCLFALPACKKQEVKKQVILTFRTFGFIEAKDQILSAGSTASLPAETKKNVWNLEGWYKDEYYTEKFDFSSPIYESDTVYAKWIPAFRTVSTFAGDNSGLVNYTYGPLTGYTDGMGTNANFWGVSGITIDSAGSLYINEFKNRRVRKILPNGLVTTIAGSGIDNSKDGIGKNADFVGPTAAMAIDSKGNLYIMDLNRLKRITPDGVVSTIAGSGDSKQEDGVGTSASFWTAFGMVCDLQDNIIITEFVGANIRKVTPDGVVTTLSRSGNSHQDGPLNLAGFKWIQGICRANDGTIFLADQLNFCIRRIGTDGIVSTFAGSGVETYADGVGTKASFVHPTRIAIDRYGNLYVTERFLYGSRLRLISPNGYVSTIWGGADSFKDGAIAEARFHKCSDIVIGKDDCIYVIEEYNNLVRKISL
jgi:hypothetical protein